MYAAALSRQDSINHQRTDSLSPWSYSHDWPTEDGSLFRSTSEIEGHSCVRCRNCTHTSTMASSGLSNRIVWDICALWGLLLNNRWIRRKHSRHRTVYTAGIRKSWRRAKECRIARVISPKTSDTEGAAH